MHTLDWYYDVRKSVHEEEKTYRTVMFLAHFAFQYVV